MTKTITASEAMQKLAPVFRESHRIDGFQTRHLHQEITGLIESGLAVYLQWRQGWGFNATITITPHHLKDNLWTLKVAVSWGTSLYSPSGAIAATELHRRIADLACRAQAIIEALPHIEYDTGQPA